jgi:hypothetical protein
MPLKAFVVKPATRRALLLVACNVTLVLVVANAINYFGFGGRPAWAADPGMSVGTSREPYRAAILGVAPGGAADHVGLHAGDRIDVRPNTSVERWQLLSGNAMSGRPIILLLSRGSQEKPVAIAPRQWDYRRFWFFLFWYCGIVLLALFAGLIAWRRPEAAGNLLLSTILASVAVGLITGPGDYALPWGWAYVALAMANLAYLVAVGLWVAYAARFATPLSGARRIVQWLCLGCVVIAVGVRIATVLGVVTLWFDPLGFMLSPYWRLPLLAAVAMAVICSALAIAASRGVERQKAAWALVPFSIFFAALQLTSVAELAPVSYSSLVRILTIANLSSFLMPAVLVYVALSRRLIDIGFVLNRAAVFAIVSVIVVGAFVLVEWSVSAWLAGSTHTTSAVIAMVVALALGLSLRYIHKYVDRFVDRVFFRKRYEDEAALRRFAHESSYITDTAVLLDRAVCVVKEHTNAENALILVRDGGQSYRPVSNDEGSTFSENDPAMVALRAWGRPVDLHGIRDTRLVGDVAFPMISRGVLVGALVCGAKRNGETFAPDESSALLTLASSVGTALDTLTVCKRDGAVSERETLTAIVERLDAIASKLNRPNT